MLSLQPAIESANLARRVGVVLGSLLVTFYYCSKVLLRALVGRLGRADVDRYTRRWSGLLLRLVRMHLSVHGQMPDFNDGRRYILLSSHASHYDIPASFVALPLALVERAARRVRNRAGHRPTMATIAEGATATTSRPTAASSPPTVISHCAPRRPTRWSAKVRPISMNNAYAA